MALDPRVGVGLGFVEFVVPLASAAITAGASVGSAFIVSDAQTRAAKSTANANALIALTHERIAQTTLEAERAASEQRLTGQVALAGGIALAALVAFLVLRRRRARAR